MLLITFKILGSKPRKLGPVFPNHNCCLITVGNYWPTFHVAAQEIDLGLASGADQSCGQPSFVQIRSAIFTCQLYYHAIFNTL